MLNGLQLLESWQEYFGNPEGAKLGLIAAGNRLGQFGSLIIIAPLIQKLGRRWPILIGSSIVLLGVALQTAAQNRTMFIMGRVVLGFGNNIQQSCCIILISEVAHPDHRPQLTGLTNSVGSIGQIMAAWITYGSASVPGSWSWRLPSLLQAVSSIFQMIMVWFMPESPRWLIGTGREQEARRILTKYHAEGVEDSDIVRFEMTQIQKTLQPDKAKYSSWMEWFRTPANRHRFLIILTLPWMMQWTGNGIISYYLGLLLESVGITEEDTKLKINGGLTITGFVWAILWSLNMDRIGRRKLLLTAMGGIFCALVILTVLSGINQAHDFSMPRLAAGAVAMVWVHQAFYKMAAPTKDPYFMEVSPYSLRAKTAAVTQFGDAGANVFNGFVNPIGLDIIKWRYYLVWVCLVMSHFVIIYLFFPEVSGVCRCIIRIQADFSRHKIFPLRKSRSFLKILKVVMYQTRLW